jgi:hypothetical protein
MRRNEVILEHLNEQLKNIDEKLIKHIRSAKPIANPKYMVEPFQHETMWSDEDDQMYYKLNCERDWLINQIEKYKM